MLIVPMLGRCSARVTVSVVVHVSVSSIGCSCGWRILHLLLCVSGLSHRVPSADHVSGWLLAAGCSQRHHGKDFLLLETGCLFMALSW